MNASMLPVGVSWGFRDREELINSGAKYIVDKPMELISDVIDGLIKQT